MMGEIEAAKAEITTLEARVREIEPLRVEIATLTARVLANRSVGIVDWGGPVRVFMYADDRGYLLLDPKFRYTVSTKERLEKRTIKPKSSSKVYLAAQSKLLERIICHYWENDLPCAYFDVGAQYGSGAIEMAM
ncbi:MAG: hypothetical protein HY248_01685, partial [Fimbriimonas ginsengisoli]|nr:hypothetical protein [Fimbriimonas ginsengisoli]